MREWNPNMDEAPRDGTRILLVLAGYQPAVGYFDGEFWEYQDAGDFAEEEHWLAWQERSGVWLPTHWMPLPEPPETGNA